MPSSIQALAESEQGTRLARNTRKIVDALFLCDSDTGKTASWNQIRRIKKMPREDFLEAVENLQSMELIVVSMEERFGNSTTTYALSVPYQTAIQTVSDQLTKLSAELTRIRDQLTPPVTSADIALAAELGSISSHLSRPNFQTDRDWFAYRLMITRDKIKKLQSKEKKLRSQLIRAIVESGPEYESQLALLNTHIK